MKNMKTKENYSPRVDLLKKHLVEQAKEINMDCFISFNKTSEMLNNYVDNELRKHGINLTQVGILYNLILGDGTTTPTEVSSSILRSKHATTKAIDSLEKLGFTKSEKTELKHRSCSRRSNR